MTTKCRQNKPPSPDMAPPIPDTPDNVAKAVLTTPPKTPEEWEYLKPRRGDERPHSSRHLDT